MEELLWKLFKETGNIKYYLLHQEIKKRSDEDENHKCRGDLS